MIVEALYKNVMALDRVAHRTLRIKHPFTDLSRTSGMNAVFVTAVEFADVCREYPIVFVRAGKDAQSEGTKELLKEAKRLLHDYIAAVEADAANGKSPERAAPAAFLILLCVALTAGAGPVMTYLESAAQSLHSPQVYIRVVKGMPQEMQ